MSGRSKRKLKNYFIHSEIQSAIISANFLYMAFVVVITLIAMQLPAVLRLFQSGDDRLSYRAAQAILYMSKGFSGLIPALSVFLVLFFIQQILITHRICGPLINFSHTFRSIQEGNLTRKVFLRRGDFLKKECIRISDMVNGLAGIIAKVKEEERAVLETLDQKFSGRDDLKELREKINTLHEALAQLTVDEKTSA